MKKRQLTSLPYDDFSISRLEWPTVEKHPAVESNLFTDKKIGFNGDVPPNINSLRFIQYQKERLGGISIVNSISQDPEGNEVAMSGFGKFMKVKYDKRKPPRHYPVCGFPTERSNLLMFYYDNDKANVAFLDFATDGTPSIRESRTVDSLGITNFTDKVYCHAKRFVHDVEMVGGAKVRQELYFVAMSLKLAPPMAYQAWTTFVENNPTFPLVTNTASARIGASKKLLDTLERVNGHVNNAHPYISDGQLDNWEILTERQSGDCEDLALTKADILLKLGLPASAIHIETGKTSANLGHAWLVVQTTAGDYALDADVDKIQCDRNLTYTKKQRQTGVVWKNLYVLDNFIGAEHAGYDSVRNEPNVWWYIFNPDTSMFTHMYTEAQQLPYNVNRRLTTPINDDYGWGNALINFNPNRYHNDGQALSGTTDYNVRNEVFNPSADYSKFFASKGADEILQGQFKERADVRGVFGLLTTGTGLMGFLDSKILFVDTAGWVYYTQIYNRMTATDYSIYRDNLITKALQTFFQAEYSWTEKWLPHPIWWRAVCKSLDSVVITSPDGYYDAKFIYNSGDRKYQEDIDEGLGGDLLTSTQTSSFDTIPAGSFSLLGHILRPGPLDSTVIDFEASAEIYNPIPGMFGKTLASAFNDHMSLSNSLDGGEEYVFTIETPFESIPCGEVTIGVDNIIPARRWPVAWFHLQGLSELVQAFMVSTAHAPWDTPFGESTSRIYKNSLRIDEALADVAGVSVDKILGLVYVPKKE